MDKDIKDYNRVSREQDWKENLGEQIIIYIKNAFWVGVAVFVVYYSNFFHNLFNNPNINELFFEISMAGYTIMLGLTIFTAFVMPKISGKTNVEDYNPKLISIGAVVGLISVLSLIICIWPVWGWWSLIIFISLWKGFFSFTVFIPGGTLGNVIFFILIFVSVISFYFI